MMKNIDKIKLYVVGLILAGTVILGMGCGGEAPASPATGAAAASVAGLTGTAATSAAGSV